MEYVWDDQNRLVGVELNSSPVVTYEYDSKSRLLQRVEGATTTNYHWDGWSLVREEKTGAVTETTNYLVPAGAFERGGNFFYLHGDALSSTQLVTDENGDQVGRFIYSAWGDELYASESVPGILENRFVGGLGCRRDAATGLIYMRHRWYDPQLQRFISRDPIGLRGGSNLYAYPADPVRLVDPTGLDPYTLYFLETGGNPSNLNDGHSGIYLEGVGVYSMASDHPYDPYINEMGSPEGTLRDFLDVNAWRGVNVYNLNITPDQRAKLEDILVNGPHTDGTCDDVFEYIEYLCGQTCAGKSNYSLEKATILPPEKGPLYYTSSLKERLKDAGATYNASMSIPDPRPRK